jgi:hypothetical protein
MRSCSDVVTRLTIASRVAFEDFIEFAKLLIIAERSLMESFFSCSKGEK